MPSDPTPPAPPETPEPENDASTGANFEADQMIRDQRVKDARAHEKFVDETVQAISQRGAAIFLFALVFAFFSAGAWRPYGILTVAALACFIVGAGLGFLFGIPKIAQARDSAGSGSAEDGDIPRDNTNLEQISDWFVKLLIGAGLVQMNEVKKALESLARSLARSLLSAQPAGVPAAPGAPDSFFYPFCLFLIIFFTSLGFLAGYLITRLWLPLVIVKSGLAMKLFKSVDDDLQAIKMKMAKTVQDLKTRQSENLKTLQECLLALQDAIGAEEAGRPDTSVTQRAIQLSLDCQKLFPTNRFLGICMGRLAKARGDLDRAVEILQQFSDAYAHDRAKAGLPLDKDYAAFFFNKACYENLMARKAGTPVAAETARNRSWDDLRKFLQYDSATKQTDLADPDLEGLFNETNRKKESL
jgi:hypothetical protein